MDTLLCVRVFSHLCISVVFRELRSPLPSPAQISLHLLEPRRRCPSLLVANDILTWGFAVYPNITYTTTSTPDPADNAVNSTTASAFMDFPLNSTSYLLLGPLQINTVCIKMLLSFVT